MRSAGKGRAMTQRLYRSQVDRMLTGVAGGMAEYLRIDPVIVRMSWVVAVILTSGVGLLVYPRPCGCDANAATARPCRRRRHDRRLTT